MREIHQQIVNIQMKPSESLVSYQGRLQQLLKRLNGTDYNVPGAHKWGILTHGLLEVYKPCVRLINMTFEKLTYQNSITKLQELDREEVGDPAVPLELQKNSGIQTAALSVTKHKASDIFSKKKIQRNLLLVPRTRAFRTELP